MTFISDIEIFAVHIDMSDEFGQNIFIISYPLSKSHESYLREELVIL